MAVEETPRPSGTRPDRNFEDISTDKLSANAPADETNDDKNARRERNWKRNERRRRLRESLLYGILQRLSIKSPTECTLPPNSASCLSLQ
jgi:myosin heavy subunit